MFPAGNFAEEAGEDIGDEVSLNPILAVGFRSMVAVLLWRSPSIEAKRNLRQMEEVLSYDGIGRIWEYGRINGVSGWRDSFGAERQGQEPLPEKGGAGSLTSF